MTSASTSQRGSAIRLGLWLVLAGVALAGLQALSAITEARGEAPFVRFYPYAFVLGGGLVVGGIATMVAPRKLVEEVVLRGPNMKLTGGHALYVLAAGAVSLAAGIAALLWFTSYVGTLGYQ